MQFSKLIWHADYGAPTIDDQIEDASYKFVKRLPVYLTAIDYGQLPKDKQLSTLKMLFVLVVKQYYGYLSEEEQNYILDSYLAFLEKNAYYVILEQGHYFEFLKKLGGNQND